MFDKMTIKELQNLFHAGNVSAELLEYCQSDSRQGVQRLWKQYQRVLAEHQRIDALYRYEYEAQKEGCQYIAGVDEAGRGPLAGPVVVAAVILPIGTFIEKLNDSKKVSPKNRDILFEEIFQKATAGYPAGADHDGQSGACRDGGGLHFEWSGAYIWQLVCHHKANLY